METTTTTTAAARLEKIEVNLIVSRTVYYTTFFISSMEFLPHITLTQIN
jgi:hypothetical protein